MGVIWLKKIKVTKEKKPVLKETSGKKEHDPV